MRTSLCRLIRVAAVVALAPAGMIAGQGDRPLKIIQTTDVRLTDPNNPAVPSTGEVRVVVLVDDTGKLTDVLLIGSTHQVFTHAAVAALQEWRFEPAQDQGKPVGTRTIVRMFFESRGRVVTVFGAEVLPALVGGPFAAAFIDRVASPDELDVPLQTTTSMRPRFPAQLSGQLQERAAVSLDFYVDETGRPRMPVAIHSAHPLLTDAALEALDQWRFAPPTRHRLPVIVRARQEFVFFERGTTEVVEPAEKERNR